MTTTFKPAIIILMACLAFIFFGGLGSVIGEYLAQAIYGISVQDLTSAHGRALELHERQALRLSSILSHFLGFTMAAIVTIWSTYRSENPLKVLDVDKSIGGKAIAWSLLMLFLFFPVLQIIVWLNLQIPLPSFLQQTGEGQDWLVAEILRMNGVGELLLALFAAAVLPAIGEELLFRGVFQKQIQRLVRRPELGIWLTAIFFSAVHLQFAGFFPRMLLGAFLGYLYYWSGSLWLPIIIHFVFNGMQVVASYFYPENIEQSSEVLTPEVSQYIMALVALVLLVPVVKKVQLYTQTKNTNSLEEEY